MLQQELKQCFKDLAKTYRDAEAHQQSAQKQVCNAIIAILNKHGFTLMGSLVIQWGAVQKIKWLAELQDDTDFCFKGNLYNFWGTERYTK